MMITSDTVGWVERRCNVGEKPTFPQLRNRAAKLGACETAKRVGQTIQPVGVARDEWFFSRGGR
jgi:hypothetical protein